MKYPDSIKVGGLDFYSEDYIRKLVSRRMAEKGVSQRKLCLGIGMSRAYLWKWLIVRKGKISYESLYKILEYLQD